MLKSKFLKNFIRIAAAFMVLFVLAGSVTLQAQAAPAWTRVGDEIYNRSEPGYEESEEMEEEKEDSIIKHMNKLGRYVNEKVESTLSGNVNFDTSISGLVMGRAGGYDISIGKFELYENNPYGIMGAIVYTVTRNIIYAFLVLRFVWAIVENSIHSGAKNRQILKEDIYSMILIMAVIYFVPSLYNLFTIARDILVESIASNLFGFDQYTGYNISSLDAIMKVLDAENGSFVYLIVRLAYLFAGWFYLGNYVLISLMSMGLFAFFPLVAVMSFKNHKFMEGWLMKLFSNALVPMIDYLFLLAPLFLQYAVGTQTGKASITFAIVTVIMIWSVIPARTFVVNALGNNMGGRAGNGFGAMAMLALRSLGGLGKGGSGGGARNEGGIMSDLSNSERFKGLEQDLNKSMESSYSSMLSAQNALGGSLYDIDQKEKAFGEENSTTIAALDGDSTSTLGNQAKVADDIPEQDDIMEKEMATVSNGAGEYDAYGEMEELDGQSMAAEYGEPLSEANFRNLQEEEGSAEVDTAAQTMEREALDANAPLEAADTAGVEGAEGEKEGYKPLESLSFESEQQEMYGGKAYKDLNQGQQFDALRYENLSAMDAYREKENAFAREASSIRSDIAAQEKIITDSTEEAVSQRSAKIASNQQIMDSNTNEIKTINKSIADDRAKMDKEFGAGATLDSITDAGKRSRFQEMQSSIKDRTMQMQTLETKNAKLAEENEKLISRNAANDTIRSEAVKTKSQYAKDLKKAESQQMAYHQAVQKREEIESGFAEKSRIYRGDGTVYSNASSFQDVQQHNETLRRQASFRNFDSSPAAGILSPEEKAKFHKDRAVAKGIKTGIGAVVKPVAAGVGFVAAAAGGSQSSMMGAMGGAMIAGGAINATDKFIGNVGDYSKAKESQDYRGKGTYEYGEETETSTPVTETPVVKKAPEVQKKVPMGNDRKFFDDITSIVGQIPPAKK